MEGDDGDSSVMKNEIKQWPIVKLIKQLDK